MKLQLGLYRWVASPQFYGWDNVPDRPTKPLIFIGNHAIVVRKSLPPPPQNTNYLSLILCFWMYYY